LIELTSGVEIVAELPVIYLRKYKALIIADTHLGFEEEMASRGILIPPFQLGRVMKVVKEALNLVDPDLFIIAGDLKHKFNELGREERKEIAELLTYLLPRVGDVIVVRGNHDNYLAYMTKKFPFKLVEYLRLGDYLIVHGHRPVPKDVVGWDTLIFGHEHPSIAVRDSIGSLGKFPCFLKGKLRGGETFITMPAVGAYQTGSKISLSREGYLSPILKESALLEDIIPVIIDEEVGILELPPLSAIADII